MFAVIFEVQPKKSKFEDYLSFAKVLKPELERIDGFMDNERFESRTREGLVLSLSTWRDEKSLIRWRTLRAHHVIQEMGRFEVFEHYHLRVGEVAFDTKHSAGEQQRLDETEISQAKYATVTEIPGRDGHRAVEAPASCLHLPKTGSAGLVSNDHFESIYLPGKTLLMASWRSADEAMAWTPQPIPDIGVRHRVIRVVRDYGMIDRREAPQYYPERPQSR